MYSDCKVFLDYLFSKFADINECLENPPCGYNAICTNTDGSYLCDCKTGYEGSGINCTGKNYGCVALSIFATFIGEDW